jgi:two-component system sensor kinase
MPFALVAANRAHSQHSLETAERQYRIAERGAETADRSVRLRVARGLGDVLMLRGNYHEAAEKFQHARNLARGEIGQAEIEHRLGELAFKRGDMRAAAESLEKGLGYLGRWTPSPRASVIFPLLWEVTIQVLHSVFPRFFVGRRPMEHPAREKELLAARLYERLAHAYWFTRGKIPTLWLALLIMNRAERYPPTPELARAYSGHAPVMSLFACFRRAEDYALRSLKMRKDAGDEWGQAQSLHYYGIVLYAASRFEECIRRCREAVRLFQRMGDYWEMNMARYQIAASLYRLGDLAGAVSEAKRMHKSGLELGDIQASGIALDIWCWATGGKVSEEILRIELQRPRDDKQATAQVLVAEGVRLLGAARPADAAEVLQRAWEVVQQSGVVNAWVAPVLPWLTTALRRQAETLDQSASTERKALLRRAGRVARRALRITRKFRNDLPHTLRELALLAAMQGKLGRAKRLFDRSLLVAHGQGARYEYARTLFHRGHVGREAGWPDADNEFLEAEQKIAQLEARLAKPARDSATARQPDCS